MKQVHGGNIFAYNVEYDFSANLNPLGIPQAVKQAVIESAPFWGSYPDPDCTALVQKISEYEDIPAEQIVCGNGADDLIFRIAAAFRPERALLCAPSFGEYRRALEAQGCCIRTHFLHETEDFLLTEEYLNALTPETDLAIVCTPNNPTGQSIPPALLEKLSERCRKNDILLLIDGCFLDFTEHGGFSLNGFLEKHVILLKAFTKSYAMPGLRLGYALCGDAVLAATLRSTGQFWSVSTPAQSAGMAALTVWGYLPEARALVRQERKFLTEALSAAGVKVFPSDANFLLFRTVPGLAEFLLREKILIRSCESFEGLDGRYYRIAVRTHQENAILLDGIRRFLHG